MYTSIHYIHRDLHKLILSPPLHYCRGALRAREELIFISLLAALYTVAEVLVQRINRECHGIHGDSHRLSSIIID